MFLCTIYSLRVSTMYRFESSYFSFFLSFLLVVDKGVETLG